MEELISGLVEKVGLDREKAEKVAGFLKDNASKLPEWLGESDKAKELSKKLPGGLGDLF